MLKQLPSLVNTLLILFTWAILDYNVLYSADDRPEASPVNVTVVEDSPNATRLNIHVVNYAIQQVNLAQNEFDLITVGMESTISREGWPDLPFIARCVLIPPASDVHLETGEIVSHLEKKISPVIAPREVEGRFEHIGEAVEFQNQQGFWPSEPLELGEPAILRGWRLINFRFYPMQYNRTTGEMKFNERVDFELIYEGIGENIVADPECARPSIFIHRVLQELVENPPPEPERDNYLSGSYLYIIPEVDGIAESIEPLLEWRRRQGHRVSVEYVRNNPGAGVVGNLIEEYYESDDPVEFVALVGDADGAIAVSPATNFGDYRYTCLDGNDPLPDITIGRITCSDIEEVERAVHKLITYEADPYMRNTGWFRQGVVVAATSNNGISTVLTGKYVRNLLFDHGYTEVRHWYHNQDGNARYDGAFFMDCMNWGISIYHHRGSGLNVNTIMNLPNRHGRWPAVVSLTCFSGRFVGEDGKTEAFFNSRGGAIGAIGASDATYVQYNNIFCGGIWNGIFNHRLYSFGWGLNAGKYELWRTYEGSDGSYALLLDQTNLMGDPGTHLWTDVPRIITVDHNEEFQVGASRFTVSVIDEEEESPEADALVCLFKEDELQLTRFTCDEGIAEFYIDPEALSEGELMVTVTKHNVKAYLEEIDVVEPDYYLGVSECEIDDEDDGDGDGIINPGETIQLTIAFTNFGSEVPEGHISFALESLSPWAEVISDQLEFDEAPRAGESANGEFILEIDPACQDQTILQLAASITANEDEWHSMIDLVVDAPKITIEELLFDGGDFEPGDRRNLDIVLCNTGHKALEACTGVLSVENEMIRINVDAADYGSIEVDRTERIDGDLYRLCAHPLIIPGMEFSLELAIETEAGFRDSAQYIFTVGDRDENDPLGPDTYGYICLDSGDEEWDLVPEYDWIEIDPGERNNNFEGESLDLRGYDDSEAIDLPFDFQYYGEEFDEITICTNGWAAFGDQSEFFDFRNRHIAQPLGPKAQLCVWWDNLYKTRESDILFFNDEENGRFIIEWNKVKRLIMGGNGSWETFEIILYDPEVYQTDTGDGIIKFQYKDVTNQHLSAQNDTPFCTIGISNLDDSDGIEYTYWNQYPPGAREIDNEMALLFITQSDFRTGVLEGTISDVETGEPIANAQVLTTRRFRTETDDEGYYIIDNILIGEDYAVTASAQGWNDSTLTGFDIVEGETLRVDFTLLHPEFVPSVEALSTELHEGESVELEFSLSNTGNGPLVWRAERHLRGDVDADPWELRSQHMVGEITGDSRIQGVLYFNDHYYIAGANNRIPRIYVINRDGQIVNQFEQFCVEENGYGIRDMAWDGEWIWGSGEEMIFAFTPEGELMREFQGPWNPNHNFAWDTDREALWVSSTTSNISALDREGNAIRVLSRCGFRIYGLAYYPDDPDDHTLYIVHRLRDVADQIIHKMNPDNGDTMFVAILEPEGGGTPVGSFITNELDAFSWVYMGVSNDGADDRIDIWQVDVRKDWFELDVDAGTLNPGDTRDFVLTLDAAGLPAIVFEGDLVFYHNAIGGENRIEVTLEVIDGDGRPDVRGLDLQSGWNLVSLNIVPDEVDVVELMQPLTDAGILLLMKDGEGRFYSPENDFNNINDGWAVTDGYQISVTEDTELEVHGGAVAAVDPIPLEEGWNMKAYFPREPIDAVTALSNIEEQLIIAKNGIGLFYFPELGFSNMGNMSEGQGYQFKVSEDVELVYNIEGNIAAIERLYIAPEHFVLSIDNCQLTIDNMSVLALCDAIQAGWEIGVFNKSDNLIGSGRIDINGRCGIAVWGDDPVIDNCMKFRFWDGEIEYDAVIDPIIGDAVWSADGLLVGKLEINGVLPVEFGIQSTYPNPFNGMVRLNYGLDKTGLVKLKVYDITGRHIANLVRNDRPAGKHKVVWDANQFPSGLYFVRLECAGQVASTKLMLVR